MYYLRKKFYNITQSYDYLVNSSALRTQGLTNFLKIHSTKFRCLFRKFFNSCREFYEYSFIFWPSGNIYLKTEFFEHKAPSAGRTYFLCCSQFFRGWHRWCTQGMFFMPPKSFHWIYHPQDDIIFLKVLCLWFQETLHANARILCCSQFFRGWCRWCTQGMFFMPPKSFHWIYWRSIMPWIGKLGIIAILHGARRPGTGSLGRPGGLPGGGRCGGGAEMGLTAPLASRLERP